MAAFDPVSWLADVQQRAVELSALGVGIAVCMNTQAHNQLEEQNTYAPRGSESARSISKTGAWSRLLLMQVCVQHDRAARRTS